MSILLISSIITMPYIGSRLWSYSYYNTLREKIHNWIPVIDNTIKYNEEIYTNHLYKYLLKNGYNVIHQYKENNGRKIDLVIYVNPNSWIKTGYRINIEAKYNLWTNSECDRLVGQVEDYTANFEGYTVILLLGNTKDKLINRLNKKYNSKYVDIIENRLSTSA